MLSTKIRTTIVALVASFGVAGMTVVPTVAQAKPKIKGTTVTCPDITGEGLGQPGEIREIGYNEIGADGKFHIVYEKKICGSDGKWHTVLNRVQPSEVLASPEAPRLAL